jgi:LysM repeat protein
MLRQLFFMLQKLRELLESSRTRRRPRQVAAGGLVLLLLGATGTAAASVVAAPAAWAATVTVQPGQTLGEIAAELGTTVGALAAANGLRDPNRVLAGQLLEVPGSRATNAGAGAITLEVRPGQTLSAIAARYGVSVTALAAANGLRDPNRVLAGATLVIPAPSGMALAVSRAPVGSGLDAGGLPRQLAAHPERLWLRGDFAAAASTYRVPLGLLEALCWWESGWQVAIVSSTGAVGVCQIEPATASFVDEYLAQSALNPHVAWQNIDLGAAYLGSLLRASSGDVSMALAGYYQGLASVRAHGMSPATANYVKGIEAYAAIFAGA